MKHIPIICGILAAMLLSASAPAASIDISAAFNADMVSTSTSEEGDGWDGTRTFVNETFQGSSNIPDNGLVPTGSRIYQLGAFDADNAIMRSLPSGGYPQSDAVVDIADAQYDDIAILYAWNSLTEGQDAVFTVKYTTGADDVFAWKTTNFAPAPTGVNVVLSGLDRYHTGSNNVDSANTRVIFEQVFDTDGTRIVDQIVFGLGNTTDPSFNNGAFAVFAADGTPIPEPASLMLVGAGTMIMLRRKA